MSRPESCGFCVAVIGPNDVITSVGLDIPRELGEAPVGRPAFEAFPPEERTPLERALGECRAKLESRFIDASKASEGAERWKHAFIPLPSTDSVIWILRDFTQHDAIVSGARRSEILLRHSSEVLTLLDRDLRVLYRSPSPERPLGYPDGLIGRSALEILHPDDRTAAITALGSVLEGPGTVARTIVRAQHADGTWRVLHATATNLLDQREIQAILLSYRDVTEERKAEDRLLAASRLASIGTLAAGIGHEINNPLTYVICNLDRVLELILAPGSSADNRAALSETFELIAEARDGAQRIAKIVADLKLLSTPERDELVAVDADAAAERALNIVGNQLRLRARLIKRLSKPPLALAAESRLVQVLINLLLNAAQALPPSDSNNEIEIATSSVGQNVVVSVRDNGCGMTAEVQKHIFEPYFTTKTASGGGLGLWVVRRIMEGLNGRVEVSSVAGHGSTFSVVLPGATRQMSPAPRSRGPSPIVKRGRVLVVDDDRPVAAAISRALEQWHEVTIANSGHEVLERLSLGERWDVIVTDLVMPGMNGLELRHRVADLVPGLADRFVLISGGAFDQHVRHGLETLGLDYLSKPPSVAELREAVAKLIR